ncbi:MAG TPA: tryptophan--tRNA ligase, partial [Dehalococcoidales bacterium]|nr:tryptophan--tRNA ligase [Dehalococcoidales bacterium]
VDCKKKLVESLNASLRPLRLRRAELAADPAYVQKILFDGAERARVLARQTMTEVRQKMGLR